MSTTKPRITLLLEPETHAVLQRLARLQRTSMSRIIRELLGEVTPVLASTADALEAATRASDVVRSEFVGRAKAVEQTLRSLADSADGVLKDTYRELKGAEPSQDDQEGAQ